VADPLVAPPRGPYFAFVLRRGSRAFLVSALVVLLAGVAMYAVDMPRREAEIRAVCLRAAKHADLYEIHPCDQRMGSPPR
jgi:hypothetical protein